MDALLRIYSPIITDSLRPSARRVLRIEPARVDAIKNGHLESKIVLLGILDEAYARLGSGVPS